MCEAEAQTTVDRSPTRLPRPVRIHQAPSRPVLVAVTCVETGRWRLIVVLSSLQCQGFGTMQVMSAAPARLFNTPCGCLLRNH